MTWIEGIKLFGGLAGLAALGWQLYQAVGSYLQLDLSIEAADDLVVAETSIENRSITTKTLGYALLLVGPELERPVETARALSRALASEPDVSLEMKETDDIVQLRRFLPDDKPRYAMRTRAVLPLPFFYDEQVHIADECLKHRCSIDKKQFADGVYSVRFYVFPRERKLGWRLLRSTHSLFVNRGGVTQAGSGRSVDVA
jgi:hypothetical protein